MTTNGTDTGTGGELNLFSRAISQFDEENSSDPNSEIVEGVAQPRELVYARRLSEWVLKLNPEASEPLRLAARCQHLCRWRIPREQYPKDRAGYLRWRNDLKKFHASTASGILHEIGYPAEVIRRVQELNLKSTFPQDPESRVLEDALCLVFLQYQLADLAARTEEAKVIRALRKSWKKMTPVAQRHALQLPFGPGEKELLRRALEVDVR